jgi:LmbE family N-acetylglucosaminyl deacetylase
MIVLGFFVHVVVTALAQLDLSTMRSAVMVVAHPDDVEGTSGGLVKLMTEAGISVHYIIVTNGDKGCANAFCANYTSQEIAVARYQEQINAGIVLGVPAANITMLDYEDCFSLNHVPDVEVTMEVVTLLRKINPDAVFTWYGYPLFSLMPHIFDDLGFHPDHQLVGRLTLDAVFGAQTAMVWPSLGAAPPWNSNKKFFMFCFTTDACTHYVDIGTTLSSKVKSYLAHKSQCPDANGITGWLTDLAKGMAANTGVPGVTYAENFQGWF